MTTEYSSEFTEAEQTNISKEFQRVKVRYLDHAGTTLYSELQLQNCCENLSQNLYSNPHTSKLTGDLIDQVRFRILKHFNTNSSQYNVVFTCGTTASLKLIAECFSFESKKCLDDISSSTSQNGSFIYVKDNHTSVLGMREIVQTDKIDYIEKDDLLNEMNRKTDKIKQDNVESNSLLVFSAQCNYNGYKIPLKVIDHVHNYGVKSFTNSRWFVCLDAASYVSTNHLDLSKFKPDFVCLSFYKMFGYPTGLGALLVRKSAEDVINKRFYGGGTVKISMSEINWHRKKDVFHERLEDGTVPFLSVISLLAGFNTIERLVPPKNLFSSMLRISNHVFNLAAYLYNQLKQLKYRNGMAVIEFNHDSEFNTPKTQGGIVNFSVLHDDGRYIGFSEIGHMASIHNIHLRTGCFCNIGACQRHLKLSNEVLRQHYSAGHVCGDTNDLIDGVPTGSVRVSIGYMTTKLDVDAVVEMIRSCYLREEKPMRIERPLSLKGVKTPRLKSICVFPIKSCGALKVLEWPLSTRGLLYDREWVIVNDDGTALTQKTNTRMCMIRPEIDLVNKRLILNFRNTNSITIEIDDESPDNSINSINLCETKVCGDRIQGYDCGDAVAGWLSDILEISGLRLIRQIEEDGRISRQSKSAIALSNQAQFLLINQTSVHWLAEKVDDWIVNGLFPIKHLESVLDRFRGNLIIETTRSLEEMKWEKIVIGGCEFIAEGPCTRCQMICIDQSTGEKTTEPLKTIAKEFGGKMRFGLYLSQVEKAMDSNDYPILKCGQEVTFYMKN